MDGVLKVGGREFDPEPVMWELVRKRALFIATVVAGAVCWTAALRWLSAADGSTGLSLTTARIGFVGGVIVAALAGLPALALGVAASATGGRLSGVMAVAMGLMFAGGVAGPIDGWVYHQPDTLPGRYIGLMAELLFWQGGVLAMLLVIQKLRDPMHARWPALAYEDHLEVELAVRRPQAATWGSAGLCALIGGVLAYWLVRDSDGGQVAGGLFISFLAAALITQMLMPKVPATGALFAPAIVGLFAYGYVMYRYDTSQAFLAAWYNVSRQSNAANLPGPALALPVHYASAGLLGVAAGLAWARTMISQQSAEEAGVEDVASEPNELT